MNHEVIRDAIISKRSVTAHDNGHVRRFSPHTLGSEADGEEVVIGYQYAGDRPGGLPRGGDWCCLLLAEIDDVQPNDDGWQTGAGPAPRDHLAKIEIWIQ